MRFLTDENIAGSVVVALRNERHDVIDVKEKRWFGRADTYLIAIAQKERRIILTHDKDFTYQEKVPVILLRFRDQKPANVRRGLIEFLHRPETRRLRGPIVGVLSECGVEFHHPFTL